MEANDGFGLSAHAKQENPVMEQMKKINARIAAPIFKIEYSNTPPAEPIGQFGHILSCRGVADLKSNKWDLRRRGTVLGDPSLSFEMAT